MYLGILHFAQSLLSIAFDEFHSLHSYDTWEEEVPQLSPVHLQEQDNIH